MGRASEPHRSTQWRQRNVEIGLCYICARPREDSPSTRLCNSCLLTRRLQMALKRGTKPWRPGFPGRPPLRRKKL